MEYVDITPAHQAQVNAFIAEHWHSTNMAIRGALVDMTRLPGIIAREANDILGLVTYRFSGADCEITSLDSLREGVGIGTELLRRVTAIARARGCRRLTLITTNDNIHALRFYQRRGFDMARLYRNALQRSRQLKPSIPLIGEDGIPLRHEIEFEMILEENE